MALQLRTDCPIGDGMANLNSFRTIIELWPSREGMAADLPGTTATQVSKWWQRDSVPAEWWSAILATEVAGAAGLNAEALTALAARQPIAELEEART